MSEPPHTSAILLGSLWGDISEAKVRSPRRRLASEAMTWQEASQVGNIAAHEDFLPLRTRQAYKSRDPNRLNEIHGLIGAIGEQAALCWTFEQDARRQISRRNSAPDDAVYRIALRATSESSAHFLLGAAHALGNLGIRTALLDSSANTVIRSKAKGASFAPGADDRASWLTLATATSFLTEAVQHTPNDPLRRLVRHIEGLRHDPAFKALENRRGMDYHRMRPQSVPHTSPRSAGPMTTLPGILQFASAGAAVDPDADGESVHQVLVEAMEPLRATMVRMRSTIPLAIRGAGHRYTVTFDCIR
jgi:hypothetical protein